MIPDNLPEARCAYGRCQAGGVILEWAPRIVAGWLVPSDPPIRYHPGCWAAAQHERARAK